MEDLTGKKYGKLTVIKFIERKDTSYYWLCKCECGNEKIVTASNLKKGSYKRCGCLREEQKEKRKKNKYIGWNYYLPFENEVKDYSSKVTTRKLNRKQLEQYLKELQYKEVQYRGGKNNG